jgi:Ca2+/Na+ antiporter
MEGLMTDPNWSKPGRTFIQNWVKGLPDKLLWLLALPLMFLRWISVPSCHHRPDYFRGPKKIAFHASFFFTPLIFGLAFIGIDDLNDVKYIWFGIFGASILFVICLNIFYFKIVAPTVIEYNIKRKEVQGIVANKKEEDYLDEYELKKISELMLQYNIDQDDEHAKPTVMKIFMLICSGLAFIGSLAWLALIAGELVEILSALGQMFSISPIFLGITVLAIGNSVVDAAANLGLAKQGKMVVAYSSIFSAPIAGSSLGFGIAVLLTTLTSTSVIKYKLSPSIFLCWGAVVGSIILYCISIPFLFNYRPTNKFGFLLAGYYSLFLIAAIILEVLS